MCILSSRPRNVYTWSGEKTFLDDLITVLKILRNPPERLGLGYYLWQDILHCIGNITSTSG